MSTKTDRLELRLSQEQRELLERAAAINGQALSSFVRSELVERAGAIIEHHSRTLLSTRDFGRFLDALDRDTPSPRLKAAFHRRKRGRG